MPLLSVFTGIDESSDLGQLVSVIVTLWDTRKVITAYATAPAQVVDQRYLDHMAEVAYEQLDLKTRHDLVVGKRLTWHLQRPTFRQMMTMGGVDSDTPPHHLSRSLSDPLGEARSTSAESRIVMLVALASSLVIPNAMPRTINPIRSEEPLRRAIQEPTRTSSDSFSPDRTQPYPLDAILEEIGRLTDGA